MGHLSAYEFQKCVARYRGDSHGRGFSCWDQYLAMAFAQLTHRESLRDIEACLRAMSGKLYHMGFRGRVPRVRSCLQPKWSVLAPTRQRHILMLKILRQIMCKRTAHRVDGVDNNTP